MDSATLEYINLFSSERFSCYSDISKRLSFQLSFSRKKVEMQILQCYVFISLIFEVFSEYDRWSEYISINDVAPDTMLFADSALQAEWPWLVALKSTVKMNDRGDGLNFCGGSLISRKIVLTAADCLQEKYTNARLRPVDFEVHLGRHDLSDKNELKSFAKILEPIIIIAMHPEWSPTEFRYDADLALIIAGKPIEYSPSISSVHIPVHGVQNEGLIGTTIGWEYSSDDIETLEDKPRKVEVERVTQEDCFLDERDLAKISSRRTFCVKGVVENAGPCTGDSGNF